MNNLSDITVIRDVLSRHGFHFSKSLGQNFLINPGVCPRMAEECGASPESGVLEIGPGIGVLTAELARRARRRGPAGPAAGGVGELLHHQKRRSSGQRGYRRL